MYVQSIALVTLFASASAFTLYRSTFSQTRFQILRSSRSDQGWNNDSFLEALGSSNPNEALGEANEQYFKESENRAAFRERRMQSMMRDGVGGNDPIREEMYRRMTEKEETQAQQSQFNQSQMQGTLNPAQPNPLPDGTPAQTQPPQAMDPQQYYQLQVQAWQEQVTAIAQFAATNPEAAKTITMPPPPPPPPANLFQGTQPEPQAAAVQLPLQQSEAETQTQADLPPPPPPQQPQAEAAPAPTQPTQTNDADPQKFAPKAPPGRNRDAYEITNSADVYFAQLKRDSTVRHQARQRGDIEFSNKVFEEKGVKALGNYLSDELQERRREQRKGNDYSTSRDEMLIPYVEEEDEDEEASKSSGISYKKKLEEMRNRRK